MRVQSRLRFAARQIEDVERSINAQQKNMTNALKQSASIFSLGVQTSLQDMNNANMDPIYKKYYDLGTTTGQYTIKKGLSKADQEALTNDITMMQQNNARNSSAMAQLQQMGQASMQQAESMVEAQVVLMREMQLQPLKDLEDDLQTEKDSLETQIQLAQADYDACKEMEKAGVKNLVPSYTGGQS